MKNNLDKQLEERRKKSNGDFEHRIACNKNFWKLLITSPIFYFGVSIICLCFFCFGEYYQWNKTEMIGDAFKCFLTSLITGLIQHFITKEKTKNRNS